MSVVDQDYRGGVFGYTDRDLYDAAAFQLEFEKAKNKILQAQNAALRRVVAAAKAMRHDFANTVDETWDTIAAFDAALKEVEAS